MGPGRRPRLALSPAAPPWYGTLLEDTFFSNRAYFLVDKGGVPRWSHVEDNPGQRREDGELLEAIRLL